MRDYIEVALWIAVGVAVLILEVTKGVAVERVDQVSYMSREVIKLDIVS